MMDVLFSIIFFSLTVLPSYVVQADVKCGIQTCYGSGAYCCGDVEVGCCWKTYIYEFWWFWIIWVIVFLLILACSGRYWRRRWRERRLAVMASSQYPTYGTVVQTQSNNTNTAMRNPGPTQGQSSPYYAQQPPSAFGYAPSALPSYADSEASKNEKPPAYSA